MDQEPYKGLPVNTHKEYYNLCDAESQVEKRHLTNEVSESEVNELYQPKLLSKSNDSDSNIHDTSLNDNSPALKKMRKLKEESAQNLNNINKTNKLIISRRIPFYFSIKFIWKMKKSSFQTEASFS